MELVLERSPNLIIHSNSFHVTSAITSPHAPTYLPPLAPSQIPTGFLHLLQHVQTATKRRFQTEFICSLALSVSPLVYLLKGKRHLILETNTSMRKITCGSVTHAISLHTATQRQAVLGHSAAAPLHDKAEQPSTRSASLATPG